MGNFKPAAMTMTMNSFISPNGDPNVGMDFGPFAAVGSGIATVRIFIDPAGVNGYPYGNQKAIL